MILPNPEEQPTVDLWPTAGQALGLSRPSTYEAARRGEIPGAMRFGQRWRVATAELRRALHLDPPVGEVVPLRHERSPDAA